MNQMETSLWQLLRKNLKGFATRIENIVSTGFPDVVVSHTKIILIELKVEKNKWVYFRSSQIAFFVRMRRTSEHAWILTRSGDQILISDSNELLNLTGIPYKEGYLRYRINDIVDISLVYSKPWDWTHINEVLFTE